jgi:membrane associated rhomboid family serine protease
MFIILPVGVNYRTERCPIVTFTLMGLNILVYLVSLGFFFAQGNDADIWIYQHLWLIPAQSAWLTYLTSMFVHAGIFHLLGNMFYLFLFGCCVEDMIGRGRFLGLYLLGGFAAELAYIIGMPEHFGSEIPMGGASGAISACMGAYLLLRTRVDIDFRYFGLIFFRPFSGEFSLPAYMVVSFWFLKDLFFAWLSFYTEKGGGGVAFGAHVGGFIAGLGLIGLHKLTVKKAAEPGRGPMRVSLPVTVRAIPVAHTEPATLFLYEGDAQSGPFNLFQVQHMLSQGTITSQALYWSEGMDGWRSVTELAG